MCIRDSFGTFGALHGTLFADESDFYGTKIAEARRYYANIVGKYGAQVPVSYTHLLAADMGGAM